MSTYGTFASEREKLRAFERRLNGYASEIAGDLDNLTDDLCELASGLDYDNDEDGVFSFSGFAKIDANLRRLKREFVALVLTRILSGVRKEWGNAESRSDALASYVLRERYRTPAAEIDAARASSPPAGTPSVSPPISRAFQPATPMLQAFEKASRSRWSARVWDLTEQHVREMELAISVAKKNGMSAQRLARELKPYLNEPDRLFRRVRDKHGNLVLSKAAREYHPGRGVYRSSHANAMRLARSEINMAYRRAEQYRWQQMGFIVGYEVRVSYARHKPDICDDLAGRYPLTFLWTGWHPNCLCVCIPLFKTMAEFGADTSAEYCDEYVGDVPENFRDWVSENSDRLRQSESRGTLPFFLQDNERYYTL